MNRILKYVFLFLGVMITANGIIASFFLSFNVGVLFTCLLGMILLICGICWKIILQKIPKYIRYAFIICLFIMATVISSFYLYGNTDTVSYSEDAVIVLGAGIRGEEIPRDLARRLDTAIWYHKKNPNAVIVVSGGKGTGEDITEALAMERYLIEKGIPQEKILKEERSTSTKENFLYTKEILDDHFETHYSVAFVTSDFHIFRAKHLAEHADFASPSHMHSTTPWYSVIPNGLRECLGIFKMWLIDQKT